MRFLCFGAGAIGTYIGGSLLLQGDSVLFLERPEVADVIRRNGLTLDLPEGKKRIAEAQAVGTLREAMESGPFEAAIFAIKSFDTAQAVEEMLPFRKDLPPLICFQNGVENEEVLAGAFGWENVIPATVTSAVGKTGPGEIVLERMRGIGLSARHTLSQPLFASFQRAGLNPQLYQKPEAMKWSKMLTNLLANASSAILDMTPLEIYSDPALYQLEVKMLKEALKVMRAQKIEVVALPGTPVDWLVRLVEVLPRRVSQVLLRKALGGGRGGKMPSFHIDLYAGRKKSEVEFLNGAVVRAGERLGIPTPVNRVFTQTLLALAQGEIPLEDFNHKPRKLISLVAAEERKHS